MSEQARIELTEILAIMLGFGNVSDLSMRPHSVSFELTEEQRAEGFGVYYQEVLQSSACYFIPVWARGYFPPDARMSLHDNYRQAGFGFNGLLWGLQSYQPIFFCAPHWLEPNCTFALKSTRLGRLTLYGLNVYPSGSINAAQIGRWENEKIAVKTIDKAQALEKAQRLAMGLQKLTEVMKP